MALINTSPAFGSGFGANSLARLADIVQTCQRTGSHIGALAAMSSFPCLMDTEWAKLIDMDHVVTEKAGSISIVGVDGCRLGWLCVELAGERATATVSPDVADVWGRYHDADLIFIDVPIGLWDSGPQQRTCDHRARQILGPRRSSVFTPPLRPSLEFTSYADASAHNHRLSGRKLSRQAWGIVPKIKEVDHFLSGHQAAHGVVREVHPEVLFWSLNGREPMSHAKKKPQGRCEREQLLLRYCPEALQVMRDVRARFLKREVADDDVLDALVAAVCARICAGGNMTTFPARPEVDPQGLPMEMVYPLL